MSDVFEGAARDAMRRLSVPGADIALLVDGKPHFQALIELDGAVPPAFARRSPVYSVTKTLIAAAMLTLVEEGRLHLDQLIGDLLPDVLPQAALFQTVSLRQTLNHTGGFADYANLRAYQRDLRADPSRPWTTHLFLERGLSQGPLFEPGAGWAYSNVGYVLLRLILERVTGQTLRQTLHRRLFGPLGLAETAVLESLHDARTLAPGYSALWSNDEVRDVMPPYHPGWVAHGLVASTAPELALLIDAIFTGRFFGRALLSEMMTPVPVGGHHLIFPSPAYGLGVMMDGAAPSSVVGHGGEGPGFSAGALHFPTTAFRARNGRRVTSVALVNRDLVDSGLTLADELARHLFGAGSAR